MGDDHISKTLWLHGYESDFNAKIDMSIHLLMLLMNTIIHITMSTIDPDYLDVF